MKGVIIGVITSFVFFSILAVLIHVIPGKGFLRRNPDAGRYFDASTLSEADKSFLEQLQKELSKAKERDKNENKTPEESAADRFYGTLAELALYIDANHLNKVDKAAMYEAAIRAFVAAMKDKYAEYYTPEEFAMFEQEQGGKYYGIGIQMVYDSDRAQYKISTVNPGYGAEEAGIKSGMYIRSIDGKEMTMESANGLIAGIKKRRPGDRVKLEMDDGGEIKTFDVEVKEVTMSVVKGEIIDGNVLYISMSEFDDLTHQQLMDVYKAHSAAGLRGIILDLRNNPGGDLKAVINVGSEFLDKCLMTYTEDRDGQREDYMTNGSHGIKEPMVVLCNGGSASASELLIAALKHYDRAKIIGSQTYGKGVVQEIRTLQNGGALRHTVQRYMGPDGTNIDEKGITPDIVTENKDVNIYDTALTEQEDIVKALEILK
ncbi:MAG: S41 family peptidase [Eubacteriales bacterium]|nr:S41 family peptidase [Eubacteriales bacterium]